MSRMTDPSAAPSRRLTPEELTVWRKLLRANAQILRRLEGDLVAEHGLALAAYDVLGQLVEAPDRRLRMTELADRVLLSRSGLTRLVDRLERDRLVVREACLSDARGLFAVLTDEGYARLRAATSTHYRGVDSYVLGRLSADQLASLDDVLDRLVDDEPGRASGRGSADDDPATAASSLTASGGGSSGPRWS